jgi:hypothetical protein
VFALVFAAAVVALGVLASAAAAVPVYVSPMSGGPTTTFVVRFRAPSATSTALHRRYVLYASGGRGSRCTSNVSLGIGATSIGSHVRVTLKPRGRAGTWCTGKFRGRIMEYISTVCTPLRTAIVCADIVIAPQTIGRFVFSVHRAGGAGGGSGGGGGGAQSGPTFAGLQTATTCVTPGRKPQPTVTAYELTWSAATDPLTPSAQIVYEIFYSPTSGGENYASPIQTTPPGTTQYSVTVPARAQAYFVVRARDSAGIIDDNTVERLGVNTCTNSRRPPSITGGWTTSSPMALS